MQRKQAQLVTGIVVVALADAGTLRMVDLYNRIMDEENKRQRSGVKKSMWNRCVKTGSKHFDKETLNKLLIDSGWEGLKEKEILFFYN